MAHANDCRRTRAGRALGLRIALVVVLAAPAALGQSAEGQSAESIATAKAAIVEARELRAKGDLRGALPKFNAAYALVPTPLTGLDYGSTLAQLGQLVEAGEVLASAAKLPGEATENDVHRKARERCVELASELKLRIPTLVLALRGAPAGAIPRVTIDGREIPAAATSVPQRLNPGHHTVNATVEGRTSSHVEVDLAERATKQVELDLSLPAQASPDQEHAAVLQNTTQRGLGERRILALVVGATGLVATGVGASLNLSGKSSYDEAAGRCANGLCSRADADAAGRAATLGTVGAVVMVAGVLTLAGGVVLWLTAPKSSVGVGLTPYGLVAERAW
jgi:hypothetical protein